MALNRSADKNICPPEMEITLVGNQEYRHKHLQIESQLLTKQLQSQLLTKQLYFLPLKENLMQRIFLKYVNANKKHPLGKLCGQGVFFMEWTFGDKLVPVWRDYRKLLKMQMQK